MQFTFNGFGGIPGMDMLELTIELKIGDAVMDKQVLRGPYLMIYQQCQDMIVNISQDERPMKLTMVGEKVLELPNGNTTVKPSKLIYANNVYMENFKDIEE